MSSQEIDTFLYVAVAINNKRIRATQQLYRDMLLPASMTSIYIVP